MRHKACRKQINCGRRNRKKDEDKIHFDIVIINNDSDLLIFAGEKQRQ